MYLYNHFNIRGPSKKTKFFVNFINLSIKIEKKAI
jgi:hypothetical protein